MTYKPAPMSKRRLKIKRDHSRFNPHGRTAELMGHIDYQAKTISKLRAVCRQLVTMYDDGWDTRADFEQVVDNIRKLIDGEL